jgi:predicted flap endonuclease-1-like 5' DNA nuclease
MVSSLSLLPEFKTDRIDPETAPHVMVGAASPLWLLFGSAAAAGATWWWWTARWREAVNLEALAGLAPELVAPVLPSPEVVGPAPVLEEAAVEAVAAPVETVAEMAETTLETTAEAVEEGLESASATAEAVVEAAPAEAAPLIEPAAKATAAVVETTVEVSRSLKDDLTRMVGIGPKLAAGLGDLGVTRFSQIAAWTPDELASFDQLLGLKGRADRDAWIAQAKRFATDVPG